MPVCRECLDAIQPVRVPQCVRCGERLVPAQLLVGDGQCQACRDYPPEFERAVSFGGYDSELRDLIHLLKYERVLPAARPLGELLAAALDASRLSNLDGEVLIAPVPLHASKKRERNFNQSELIARAAVKHLAGRFRMATDILVRHRATLPQVGLDRAARIQNMRGAFRVTSPERIAGCSMLLVDDVMTTGTTLSECARVLKVAGAAKVYAATVARVLKAPVSADFGNPAEGERAEATEFASA